MVLAAAEVRRDGGQGEETDDKRKSGKATRVRISKKEPYLCFISENSLGAHARDPPSMHAVFKKQNLKRSKK